MLLRFRVENFRSVRDVQELTLLATPGEHATVVRMAPVGALTVSPVVGVFGPTASGRSTLVAAFVTFRSLVLSTADARTAVARHDPFQLDHLSPQRPTRFEVEFVVGATRYAYGVGYLRGEVVTEWLHAYPADRRQIWYVRERGDTVSFPGGDLGGDLGGLVALLRPDLTLLSLAMGVGHPQLSPIVAALSRIRVVEQPAHGLYTTSLDRLANGWTEDLTLLLTRAGLGITGVELTEEPSAPGDPPYRQIRLVHDGPLGPTVLPARTESAGTVAWLALTAALLPALDEGGLLLADDLDGRLDAALIGEVVRILRDPELNTGRAQLVFTGRDDAALRHDGEEPVLAGEQVWRTRKDRDGVTTLTASRHVDSGPVVASGTLAQELWLQRASRS